MSTNKEIKFSSNWNNKLYCNIFATLRFGECMHKEGDTVSILLRKESVYVSTGEAIIINIFKDVPFHHLRWFLPIDTGYSLLESEKLFKQFNCNKEITDDTPVNVIVLQRLTKIILSKL